MIRVSAPTRLHFGLFNDGHVNTGPFFGGLGLMLKSPRVEITVERSNEWLIRGPGEDRVGELARQLTPMCHQVMIERCPPQHIGLGVGTARALTVATALMISQGIELPGAEGLARITQRGRRSGIGLHGFFRGGFLHDGGKDSPDSIPTLANRVSFPNDWQILLVQPDFSGPWHGQQELNAFKTTMPSEYNPSTLAGPIIRAIQTRDFDGFTTLLSDFNRLCGRMFERNQGGIYASPEIANVVTTLENSGIRGVGQSSWGPTVFGFTNDPELAGKVRQQLAGVFPESVIETTTADDTGAIVSRL